MDSSKLNDLDSKIQESALSGSRNSNPNHPKNEAKAKTQVDFRINYSNVEDRRSSREIEYPVNYMMASIMSKNDGKSNAENDPDSSKLPLMKGRSLRAA